MLVPYLLQQCLTLVSLAALYALIAIGYSLTHTVTRQFNLAHGGLVAIGAYAALIALVFGYSQGALAPLAFLLLAGAGLVTAATWGWAMHRLIYRPLARDPGFAPLVATIGLSIAIAEGIRLLQQSGTLFVRPVLRVRLTFFAETGFPVVVTGGHAAVLAVSGLALAVLFVAHGRTGWGRALRAVADDPGMAALVGLSPGRIAGGAFLVAGALAGLAGGMIIVRYGVASPYMGLLLGLKGLTAAIVGGIGSPRGALAGAVLLATVETVWQVGFPGDYKEVAVFALLVIALIFRPDGLVARPVVETAPGIGAVGRR